MNRRFPSNIAALLIISMTCTPAIAQLLPGFLQLPQHSVATVEGALSPVVNPAGLGIYNGGSLLIMAPYLGKADFGDWGFALGGEDIGFITEVRRNSVNENRARYTWGFGFGYRMLSFGTAYSYTNGFDRQNNWDIGGMARPFQFLSLGAVARGINNPRLLHPETGIEIRPDVGWDLGIAIRPTVLFKPPGQRGGQRLTLFADASLRQFNRIGDSPPESYQDNIVYKFGASAQIAPGIIGYVDYHPEVKEGIYTNEEQIYGGLSLSFGKVEVGGFQRHGTGEGVSWVASNSLYRHTLLRRHSEKFVEIRLSGPLVEYQPSISWFTPKYRTVYELLRQIEKYGNDPDVAGILLRLDDFSAGWAKLQEIRDALLEFEYTGKSLIVYLETCGNGGYYLASVADNIFMNPVGEIGLTGLSAHSVFISRTLDMAGIDPEFEHVGKYKSATETYTREDMSDEMREEIEYILDDLFDDFVAKIADGRGYINEQVLELIDDGPFSAADAYSAGLVDELIYEDEIEEFLKEYVGENIVLVREKNFNRHIAANDGWYDLRRKSIAIVYATGAIMRGESSEAGLFGGEIMGSTTN
ncbi:S49 family peptidase, partial [bacterium]|nr:S49 family peptidase [bacterium]